MIPLIDPGDTASFTIDWSDALGSAVLGTVTHVVPAPLAKVDESTDASSKQSTVRVTGAVHGGMYQIEGSTTLNTGEVLNRQFPLRCFNG